MEISPVLVGGLGLALLLFLMALGVPIGFAFALSGFAGLAAISGFGPGIGLLGRAPYTTVAGYTFAVIPLFMAMGEFAVVGGLATDGYTAAQKWMGHLPGGLAHTTIGASALFGAVCGSGIATAITMTKVAWPEMRRYKYSPSMGLASICSAGPLAILIPPSIPLIIYGMLAEESVGRLFMAGIFPGLLLAALLMITVLVLTKLNPSLAPRASPGTWRERFRGLGSVWGILLLVILVMGGIWGGVCTPNEAAGFGAFGAFIIALCKRRLTWDNTKTALRSTAIQSASMFLMLIGVAVFNSFMALSTLPHSLAVWVASLPLSPTAILWVILLTYVFLGCFVDAPPALLLTLPLFVPVIVNLGIDKILFGVLTTLTAAMGQITPPVGMNVFAVNAMVRDVPIYTIFRGVVPFLIAILVCLIICIYVPQISLWLPGTMSAG